MRSRACTGMPPGPAGDAEQRPPGLAARARLAHLGRPLAQLVGARQPVGLAEAEIAAEALGLARQHGQRALADHEEAEVRGVGAARSAGAGLGDWRHRWIRLPPPVPAPPVPLPPLPPLPPAPPALPPEPPPRPAGAAAAPLPPVSPGPPCPATGSPAPLPPVGAAGPGRAAGPAAAAAAAAGRSPPLARDPPLLPPAPPVLPPAPPPGLSGLPQPAPIRHSVDRHSDRGNRTRSFRGL